jgi:hypothetical protein
VDTAKQWYLIYECESTRVGDQSQNYFNKLRRK